MLQALDGGETSDVSITWDHVLDFILLIDELIN